MEYDWLQIKTLNQAITRQKRQEQLSMLRLLLAADRATAEQLIEIENSLENPED